MIPDTLFPIYERTSQYRMQLINCPKCGKRLPSGTRVCPDCGYEFPREAKKKVPGPFPWILPVIGACALLAVLRPSFSASRVQRNGAAASGSSESETSSSFATTCSASSEASSETYSDEIDRSSANSSTDIGAAARSSDGSNAIPSQDFPFLGIYSGSDSDYLTLNSDGTASYYCSEYTDLFCPWTYEDNFVSVCLPKLHCTIRASVSDPCQELFFTADNLSWTDESFTRTDAVPEMILRYSRKSNDNAVTVLADGTRLYRMGSFSFPLPSQYIDYSDSADTNDVLSDFVSADVQSDCYSLLVFYSDPDPVLSASGFTEKDFSASSEKILSTWYDGLAFGEVSETSVAKERAFCRSFSGKNNRYFTKLSDDAMEGTITSVYDDSSGQVISILFAQTKGAASDESEDYDSMLQNAERE